MTSASLWPMFINDRLKAGDRVTITFIREGASRDVGTVLGYDEHHIGLNTYAEHYIPWSAVESIVVDERAPEETYSVEESVG